MSWQENMGNGGGFVLGPANNLFGTTAGNATQAATVTSFTTIQQAVQYVDPR